jgi:amidase
MARLKDPATHDGVDRRQLLGAAALGGLGAAFLACRPRPADDVLAPAAPPFELEEASLADLQLAMTEGRLTAERVVTLYLERIDAVDRQGPTLRSVIETDPDALANARRLDDERRAGRVRGPLHGVPVLLKDNLSTHDRTTTTAGSLALEGVVSPRDAFLVAKLRDAGAVLLGKANLSEWANFRSNNSSSGWSARGGQCRNPYALDRNPCGSSSGSGAAVSANLTAVAIGTETNGSIVCPASANGVVGLKPTVGLVSRAGIVPIAHSQDTAGPMARSVADAAAVLSAIVGVDPEDAASGAAAPYAGTDYTAALDPGGARGARIGVGREFLGFDARVDELFEAALAALRQAGAELIDPAPIATRREMSAPSFQVLLYEFKADLDAYLAALGPGAPVRSLADVIAFNEANRDREMPFFGQELFEQAQEKGPLTEPAYLEAVAAAHRLAREQGIDATMDEHRLDAIVAPTGGPAWLIDLVNGDSFGGGSSSPAAIAGYPNVTLPMGFVRGLPVGISFFGRAWSEPVLLRIAYAFEQATRHRRPPGLAPTVDLGTASA